jgi:integrase/recombinase XerD
MARSDKEKNINEYSHPWVDRYLEHLLIEKGLSENSLAGYANDLGSLLAFLEEKSFELGGLTDRTLFLYLTHLRARGLKSRSLARHLSSLRGFFAFAVGEKWYKEDPGQLLENPKLPRKLPEFLSREEISRILGLPDTATPLGMRDKVMLELLYAAGLRRWACSRSSARGPRTGLSPSTTRPRTFSTATWSSPGRASGRARTACS